MVFNNGVVPVFMLRLPIFSCASISISIRVFDNNNTIKPSHDHRNDFILCVLHWSNVEVDAAINIMILTTY